MLSKGIVEALWRGNANALFVVSLLWVVTSLGTSYYIIVFMKALEYPCTVLVLAKHSTRALLIITSPWPEGSLSATISFPISLLACMLSSGSVNISLSSVDTIAIAEARVQESPGGSYRTNIEVIRLVYELQMMPRDSCEGPVDQRDGCHLTSNSLVFADFLGVSFHGG